MKKYVYDRKKIKTAIKNGFKVLEVWNFYKNIIKKCIDFIGDNLLIEDEITEIIETDEYGEMIDIEVSNDNLFLANNILTHNSMGIPATADFMAIMGTDEDQMIYESEILYKITKSRIGGRVGNVDRFYLDKRSLKMYDSSELDLWIDEAIISGDSRDSIDHEEIERQERNRRRGRRNA